MSIGIVAEYNPFHKGHEYHINKSREIAGNTPVIVVMSGDFVQRGDAAICDKFSRAEMALRCGADLVLELPIAYAMQSAEHFARGAVSILRAMDVDNISFGCECDDLSVLTEIAEILRTEPAWYKTALSEKLAKGLSFPTARSRALGDFGKILETPNNILAIEYLKMGAPNPIAIKRYGAEHDGQPAGDIASASFIRSSLDYSFMPAAARGILGREIALGKAPNTLEPLEAAIIAFLRKTTPEYLMKIHDISEGLENRIKQWSSLGTLPAILTAIKSKRYTHSRIRRVILNAFFGITTGDVVAPPMYIRLLGSTERGRAELKKSALPIVTKAARAELSHTDVLATDIYSLLFKNPEYRVAGRDFTTSPVTI